jgi:hypothetical protein
MQRFQNVNHTLVLAKVANNSAHFQYSLYAGSRKKVKPESTPPAGISSKAAYKLFCTFSSFRDNLGL